MIGRGIAGLGVVALMLAGCANASGSLDPVTWWHGITGGTVAAHEPPVPGQNAPYPNLADVPKPPPFTPPAERANISATLLADRTRAHQEMLLTPVAASAPAAHAPASPAAPAPAASPGAASAELPAAKSPAPPPPPSSAPEPSLAPATAAAGLALLSSIPSAPPRPPAIAGFPPPGPPPAPLAATRGPFLSLAFAPGSSALSPADRARLAGIAAARRGADVVVVGYGGARASDVDAQSAALRLALARAEAVATALAAEGIPPGALSLGAEASGEGASVRVVGGA